MARAAVGDWSDRARRSVDVVWTPQPPTPPADVRVNFSAGATVGQLMDALGVTADHIFIDDREVAASVHLDAAGLVRGARLALHTVSTPPPAAEAELRVIGGLLTGATFPLPPGSHTVGRDEACSIVFDAPSVSARHAVVEVEPGGNVTIADLGSTNGTWVDGVFAGAPTVIGGEALVRLGALAVQVRRRQQPVVLAAPHSGGTLPFNRPPRSAAPPAPAPVVLPSAPPEPGPRARLPWAALIAPVVLGIAMALLYDPRFAAFALFSPAMMLGTWAEDRRRARRDAREGRTALTSSLADFEAALTSAAGAEVHRLRAMFPTAGVAGGLAAGPESQLWERRPAHDDFMRLCAGVAAVPWRAPTRDDGRPVAPEAVAMLGDARLAEAPLTLDLRSGRVCGITGTRPVATALARNLVLQAVTLHGPADLRIAVFAQTTHASEWEWAKWLPHAAAGGGPATRCLVSATPSDDEVVAAALRGRSGTTLVIVDNEALLRGRDAVARLLLGQEDIAGIVIASRHQDLPALCTSVVTCDDDQGAARYQAADGSVVDDLLVAGVDPQQARDVARALARIDDPESQDSAGALPQDVALLDLLGLPDPTGDALLTRWSGSDRPAVTVGVTDSGPLELDLAADGPHGLIAGTTGAGKSELLRTLIAGLAANVGPADLNFVLIDYKGGSAFDACAALPHTVGIVTDLDETLGRRALRCLEAELRYRERLLRTAGAADVLDYRSRARAAGGAGLPRLLVAIDEFATLAAELPDFVDRLVSIAQRGRSLGVHLLLATQRPAGAVSDHIRANTNLRIALRVHDAADSCDVVGTAAAAELQRGRPGRGFVRLGPGELVAFQAAFVSGASQASAPAVVIEAFDLGWSDDTAAVSRATCASTDLERLVAAAREAFERSGQPAPRRPWPEPLPTLLTLEDVAGAPEEDGAVIGVADDPDGQRSVPFRIDPSAGSLALYGALGSGPTDTLATIVLALERHGNVHCYVVDAGRQALSELADRPHVGAVIAAGDRERQERLIRFLVDEVAERRRRVSGGETLIEDAAIVLLIDNYAAFAAGFEDLAGLALLDDVARLVADGPALGVTVVATADRVNAIPAALAATMPQRLLFGLPDRHDYAQFGVAPLTDAVPNRAVDATTGFVVQIAEPGPLGAPAQRDGGDPLRNPPATIGVLPANVPITAIVDGARFTDAGWNLPLGLDDRRLQPGGWQLGPGDHALITGPARSGKSTSLAVVAESVAKLGVGVYVYGVAMRRSPLQTCPHLDALATDREALEELVRTVVDSDAPTMLLVDDGDGVDDAAGTLNRLLTLRRDNVWCIAAGRADILRTQYGHWTVEVRRSRHGLALRPNVDLDGDLWHTPLPRSTSRPMPTGRGYLIADGVASLLQAAAL